MFPRCSGAVSIVHMGFHLHGVSISSGGDCKTLMFVGSRFDPMGECACEEDDPEKIKLLEEKFDKLNQGLSIIISSLALQIAGISS
ncbi:unnamed protein product [Cochlearia groenlandica]